MYIIKKKWNVLSKNIFEYENEKYISFRYRVRNFRWD